MTDKPAVPELEALFSSLTDALVAVNAEGKVCFFNQAAEDLTNTKADDTYGKTLGDALKGNAFLENLTGMVYSSRRSYSLHDQLLQREGADAVPVSVSAFLVQGGEGGVGLLIRDTSIFKKLEEDAKHSEQLESFRTLSLGLAHEIRNPLSGIRGAAQLLTRELEADGPGSLIEYASIVMKEVDRLDRLVEEFLGFAGSLRINAEPFNIHSLLDDVLDLQKAVQGRENVRIVRRYDPSLPPVLADRERLNQVFLNVVKNSIEAMPSGGEIVISTGMPPELVYSSLKKNNIKQRLMAVKVVDRGTGIPPEKIREVFNPFFTTKPRGLGLGLALSLKIIEEHHGTMSIESDGSSGTTVTIYLPIAG
ncbi:MAG: ATP-binding protein [Nitrospirota bacterium]|nr:ATP-binding protein [Nitrospirota bacterium]